MPTITLVLGVMGVVGGCSQAGPHTYDRVNALAAELDLTHAGTVARAERFGTGGFSDVEPTETFIYASTGARVVVTTSLRRDGFSESDIVAGRWESRTWPLMIVFVKNRDPGTGVYMGKDWGVRPPATPCGPPRPWST